MSRCALALLGLWLAGCSVISDFDFEFSDDDAGPAMDAGDRDGGPPFDAAGMDAGPEIDAGPGVDAGPAPPRCPMPCVGDALNDFTPSQGNGAPDWRYHQDARATVGTDFPELAFGTHGGLMGFGGPGGSAFVGSCADNPGAAECTGVSDHLLVLSDPPGAGTDAVISFEATSRAVLRVQGSLRLPDGVASAETHRVTVSRNARYDYAGSLSFIPTTTPTDLDVLVDVLPGDRVLVSFGQRGGAAPVPLAAQLWITRMGAPIDTRCVIGLTFDAPSQLRDLCGDFDVDNLIDSSGSPPGPSTQGMGASPWLAEARDFVEGQYIRPAATSVDYSGDFTVQFWANVSSSAPFDHSLWADSTTDAPPGGVSISMNGGVGYARTFYARGASTCTEAQPGICVAGMSLGNVGNDEWHFFRLTRSTADDEILVCVDGQRRARLPVDGSVDLTGAYRPHLGRNVTFNPAYFIGSLDDVRVYDVALPCEL